MELKWPVLKCIRKEDIGKWVFNHAFFLPGVLAIVFSVALGFAACALF